MGVTGGTVDGDGLWLLKALRAACMAIEFGNPWEDRVEGAGAAGGGGGVDREGIDGAERGGGGGADGGAGLAEEGKGGGGGGCWRADEDGFLEDIGGGGGLFPSRDTDDDGLGAGFGGGLLRFATSGFDKPEND